MFDFIAGANVLKGKEVFGISTLESGWALKTVKKGPRMTSNVKEFLTKKFDEGAKSGQKLDANQCVQLMRSSSQFDVTEWRTAKQIASFFSRLAANRKKVTSQGYIMAEVTEEEDDEFEENDQERLQNELRKYIPYTPWCKPMGL